MRLLDTTTLDVVSFLADKIPPYAILSHTWGAEQDELTLQQLQELTGAGRRDPSAWTGHPVSLKKGYLKIRAACSLALSQSYRYIWIDTCCIDKTSSAELSEAINSMYRWYEGAGACYVFLDDVDVGPGIANPDISRCKWFTRGWTLQELIAPANVFFYDYKWSYIGSKRDRPDFRAQLSKTTGVDSRVLSGAMGVDELSVACRMAWAASRTTTRPEDIAYCLMGIFQVNMPLLYGEGSRAFMRLQEEILKSVDDHSLFAWKYPKGDPFSTELSGLLAPSPRYFRETSHIMPALLDASQQSAPSSITNAGLHVQLLLRTIRSNSGGSSRDPYPALKPVREHDTDFIAILNCAPCTVYKEDYWHGLRLVALGGGQFARLQSDQLLKVSDPFPDPFDRTDRGGSRYVYVKQKPMWILPEIVVQDFEVKNTAVPYSLIDAHPSSRWDPKSKTLRRGPSRHGKVLGGFRYRVSRKVDEKPAYVDVFVIIDQIEGQLGNWVAVSICKEVIPGRTLQQVYIELSKEDCSQMMSPSAMASLRRDISRYGLTTSLVKNGNVSIRLQLSESHSVDAEELAGKEVFGSGRIHTTENLLRNRAEMDHLIGLTRRMACEVIDDSFDITFRQSVNMVREFPSKIRARSPVDWHGRQVSDARQVVLILLERVKQHASGIQVSGEDGNKLGILEQYFANRLAVACIKGDVAAARELVQTKLVSVSLESKTSGKSFADRALCMAFLAFRPIHWAAIFGYTDIVRLLTENGADRFSQTVDGFTTVHLAAIMGHHELADYLVDDWKQSGLLELYRTRRGRLEESPLHLAAAYDRTEKGMTYGILRSEMTRRLEAGDSPGARRQPRNGLGETPLHRAAAMNNTVALSPDGYFSSGTDDNMNALDGYGRTPLWHAAATGANEAVKCLLGFHPDPDLSDVYGRTPLHIACREGRPAAVKLLLEGGADVNRLTTAPCLSACHFAALAADIECLRLVVDYGGKADLRQVEGLELGAIHIAAANGWLEGVKFLVERGCDPNTPCSHLVTARGHSNTGAGVNVARFQFDNAVELAVRGGHKEVVEYLKGL